MAKGALAASHNSRCLYSNPNFLERGRLTSYSTSFGRSARSCLTHVRPNYQRGPGGVMEGNLLESDRGIKRVLRLPSLYRAVGRMSKRDNDIIEWRRKFLLSSQTSLAGEQCFHVRSQSFLGIKSKVRFLFVAGPQVHIFRNSPTVWLVV